jgi:hypothetical protein
LCFDCVLCSWSSPVRCIPTKIVAHVWFVSSTNLIKSYTRCLSHPHTRTPVFRCPYSRSRWVRVVYKNGEVCISILHPPGEDSLNPMEAACERWLPIHTVTTIALSVISMLADPNDLSPANLDAAVMWREEPAEFKKRVQRCVRRSQDDLC